jgi:dihydrolipoamide dehydrogenase
MADGTKHGDPGAIRLAIIGGGPGGYPAAFLAAQLGMQVTLIDPAPNPGGVCLFRGCIPSKALLHVAHTLEAAKEAPRYGVTFGAPALDLERTRAWKDEIVTRLTGGLGAQMKKLGVAHRRGTARFLGPRELAVSDADGREERLAFTHAIVATGSRPAIPAALRVDSPRVLDSTGALALPDVPRTLLVVGGGYIGLELGSVYAALGSEVTVVEMTDGLLPGADRDLVSMLARRLEQKFAAILLRTTVTALAPQKNSVKVTLRGRDEKEEVRLFERVLVSVGRRPNSEGLGLETTRARVDERGFVTVDPRRETAEPGLYAIGDLAGEPMLAHKATAEGRVAVEAIAGEPVAFDPRAIPAVVFTDPEIAWCGATETELRRDKHPFKAAKYPWGASGRAATLGRPEGLTKVLAHPDTGRILGVGLAGPGAGELIAEAVLAMEMGANVDDLRLTIHPHPTLSETLMETAEAMFTPAQRQARRPSA